MAILSSSAFIGGVRTAKEQLGLVNFVWLAAVLVIHIDVNLFHDICDTRVIHSIFSGRNLKSFVVHLYCLFGQISQWLIRVSHELTLPVLHRTTLAALTAHFKFEDLILAVFGTFDVDDGVNLVHRVSDLQNELLREEARGEIFI